MNDARQIDGPTAALARFAAQVRYDDIPQAAVARIKLCVLDALGCALFATSLPASRIVADYVEAMGGCEDAWAWGRHHKVPAANAALLNGTLIHGFELDDLHKKSIVHPSSVALPAALAIAEVDPTLSGAELVCALVAGFEAGIRAGMSVGTNHLLRGFHPTGTSGAIGAAAGAGRALRLSSDQMVHAISTGATQAAGLMSSQYESMAKRLHAGRAAQSGVYAAQLARRGFVGIERVFETPYGGYCTTYSDEGDLAALTDGLGERYETERVGFKVYSCCGSCHTTVEAIRRLRERHSIGAASVSVVRVHTSKATLLHVGWPYRAKSVTSAQMNLPYCAAVTLYDGNAFVEQFTDERIRDPRLLELAGRVEVIHDPTTDAAGPSARHRVRVELSLADGRTVEETVMHAKGSDADPLSDKEVVGKFYKLSEPVIGHASAEKLYEFVMSLERAPSAARLADLLAGPIHPSGSIVRNG